MTALLDSLLDALHKLSPGSAFGLFLLENVLIVAGCVAFGHLLIRLFPERVTPAAPPMERLEIALPSLCVLANTLTTLLGWALWKRDIIVIRQESSLPATILDALYLLIAMDFAMYLLHRLAHAPRIFPWLHSLHHRYDHPRPLTLFVMNPLEALAFGLLWLAVLRLYHATFTGIALYLALNAIFGTIGHVGIEPLPERWRTNRFVRYLGGSRFHAGHHVHPAINFGFYTTVWDQLFRTLGNTNSAE